MFLMRVTLPDRPGSLGAVASAMGNVGGDINAVEIVEKGDGIVVDDFIVDLPPNQMPETIVTACQSLEGVKVEWISRYPEGGGLQSDLEALERMTVRSGARRRDAGLAVPGRLPVALGHLDRGHRRTAPRSTFSTTLAPDVTDQVAATPGPVRRHPPGRPGVRLEPGLGRHRPSWSPRSPRTG